VNTAIGYLIDAISLGALDAMIALGIGVVFGLMGLVNFAYGDIITLGAYALYAAIGVLALSLGSSILILVLVTVVVALVMERVAFRPVRTADPTTMLITSFALSYILQNLEILLIGARAKFVALPPFFSGFVSVADLRISNLSLVVIAATAVLLVGLRYFLTRTSLGVQMSAASADFEMARLLGVRANRVIAAAFGISGLFAAAASFAIVAQLGEVNPSLSLLPVLTGFAGVVIGGLGSLGGAALGGFLLGFLTTLLQAALPTELTPFRDAFLFTLVIAFLLFRPQGVLPGRNMLERV
jgi:branched-chain amino acid transport system permease protein